MGIQGLKPLLKSIQKPVEISDYAGQAVAVDGHCWLRQSAFKCASEISRAVETNTYVEKFMDLVKMLLFYKVVPIIVFDGQQLPMKRTATDARATVGSTKIDKEKALLNDEANTCFQQATSITPSMVAKVIEELDRHKIQHIVSPFEAAPQLAYMEKSGQVKAVVTESSDVLAFGCSNIIFKMDCSGKGIQISCKDVCSQIAGITSPRKLRYLCILSGCSYLPSLSGLGLREALDIVKESTTIKSILQVIRNRFDEKTVDEYSDKFIKANAAFLYQFVFDSTSRTYVRFSSLPKGVKVDYLTGLGESPQNRNVPLLKSNNAIYLDHERILKESNKENIDPFVQLTPSEFNEFEFDDYALKAVEVLLKKVESRYPPAPCTGALTCITNTGRPSRSPASQSSQKRKSSVTGWSEPVAKIKKPFALADVSVVR